MITSPVKEAPPTAGNQFKTHHRNATSKMAKSCLKQLSFDTEILYSYETKRFEGPPRALLGAFKNSERAAVAASDEWERYRIYGALQSRGWIETSCVASNYHPAEGFPMTGAGRCSCSSCRPLQATRTCRLQPTSTRCIQRGYTSSERHGFVMFGCACVTPPQQVLSLRVHCRGSAGVA